MEKSKKDALVRSTRKKPIEKRSIIVDESLTMYSEAEHAKVIDNETSNTLKELKKLEVANKPKVITSEMKDAMQAEEEVVLDSNEIKTYNNDFEVSIGYLQEGYSKPLIDYIEECIGEKL